MTKVEIETQFRENLKRVRNLIDIYEKKITPGGQGRRPVGSADVLREAVVLLHATFAWNDPERSVLDGAGKGQACADFVGERGKGVAGNDSRKNAIQRSLIGL